MNRSLFRLQPATVYLSLLILVFVPDVFAQDQTRPPQPPPAPGPMLKDGTVDFDTPDFVLSLVRSSQTVAALKPKSAQNFDFTPADILVQRSQDGYHHLGDIELRIRSRGGAWKSYSTAVARTPVTALPASTGVLAKADLAPTLPADLPLRITRAWAVDGGKLVLRFTLMNKSTEPVEIGALGFSMVFNNVLNNRKLDDAHALCSFYDPYIGEDAGYLQVTRLSGHGPALVVVPEGHTPFEAYSPILSRRRNEPNDPFTDPTPRGVTFEGFYDWMVHSGAFAENEWKKAEPWNPPTTLTLKPDESKTYGLKFLVADEIRSIEKTLAANNRPVAVGIPGYILPTDTDARLFLKYPKPVKSMVVEPAGAITIQNNRQSSGWRAYTLRGQKWGRARMTVTYADGLVQTIQYRIIKPESQAVADMGRFLTTRQWFDDPKDPFHRGPSVMTYDREANQIVLQDSRVWIAGLSDEGGAGSWLAAMMKELVEPDKQELDKLTQFVDETLWGKIQISDGVKQYGVRKSLFYWDPEKFPDYYRKDLRWTKPFPSWDEKGSIEAVDRSFNYPHVAAAYWVMYRLSRNHQNLVTTHPWQWYLDHAAQTSLAMEQFAPYYAKYGQMEGDTFLEILKDLRRENMTALADQLEAKMRGRADRWKQEAYPFGSEMPWDSTGQEEVYAWTKYFGDRDKAEVTLNAVLGYMPTVPHWGYNGSARRYWDFIYGASAKYSRIERQLHHYGSGINAIPVLSEYRDHPDDLYLLRVGYAGTMGVLTNIDQEGFLAPAFHAFPDMLRPDPVSGDNGPNFFGHAMNTAAYLANDPEFGWVTFGGNVAAGRGPVVRLTPLDSARTRVYAAPLGLWLTLDAGTFKSVEVNAQTHAVRVALNAATQYTPFARLRIEQPAAVKGVGKYHLVKSFAEERGTYVIPLGKQTTWIELSAK